jgi:hypothetical protein
MLSLAREHGAEQTLLERDAKERRRRGVTFRELTHEYLGWLEDVKGAKPSTLRDHRCLLAEPGQSYRRGSGASRGLVMAALGDRPAARSAARSKTSCARSRRPASPLGRSTRHAVSYDIKRRVTICRLADTRHERWGCDEDTGWRWRGECLSGLLVGVEECQIWLAMWRVRQRIASSLLFPSVCFAGEIGAGRRVELGSTERDDVDRTVQLPVTATVQALAASVAGGRFPRLLARTARFRAASAGAAGGPPASDGPRLATFSRGRSVPDPAWPCHLVGGPGQ